MGSEFGSIQPNPHLFEIENRWKLKTHLAHEVGAGAKCLRCHENCSGFQLHFWRKICLNCRCNKESHEIKENDNDIGRIVIGKLFERPLRTKEEEAFYSYGANLEIVVDSTGKKEVMKFDWIPPGVKSTLAGKYMELLPPDKRPIAGSQAAKERKKQLEKQIPLYDMDTRQQFVELPKDELNNFLNHLNDIRKNVAGQGTVHEICPPLDATHSLAQYKDNTGQLMVQEISPSSGEVQSLTNLLQDSLGLLQDRKSLSTNSKLDLRSNYNDEEKLISNSNGVTMKDIQSLTGKGKPIENELRENSNSRHQGINVVQTTLPRPYVAKSEKQMLKPGQFCSILVDGTGEKVLLHQSKRAVTTATETSVGNEEDINPSLELSSWERSDSISDTELLSLPHFSCQYCKNFLKPGDVAVICERAGPGKYWHPQCFVCSTCKELLADLIYFYKDGQIFCGRHYTQAVDIPRCKACDELIFSDSWTRAEGFDWHVNHFCCFACDCPLGGLKYVPDDENIPRCLSCYMSTEAKMCETCLEKILPNQTRASYNGYFFHTYPECFCCHCCKKSLIGGKFKIIKNWAFCSRACIEACKREIDSNHNPMKKI